MEQKTKQSQSVNGNRIYGTIDSIRNVEDCIRATKKYTKGVFRKSAQHPIQGESSPSRVLTEYYEVYPDVDLSWDMSASEAWAWIWGDVVHIDVFFHYDYRSGRGHMDVPSGAESMKKLREKIPDLSAVLDAVTDAMEGDA